jgi:hypothetical protein
MKPKLKQNVIRFERGVGREVRPPVTIRSLERKQRIAGAFCSPNGVTLKYFRR